MQSVTLESTELSNDIAKKIQMIAKIEEEIQHAEKVSCLEAWIFNPSMAFQIKIK